jgi:hypothetical protein
MKVLFFSPHSLPWKHSFPEAIVADSLRKTGSEIVYLTCGGALGDYCIPKIAKIPGENRNNRIKKSCDAICSECQNTDKYIRKNFNLTGPTIGSILSQEYIDEVDSIIASLDIKKAFELKYHGISIGKIAFYQIILRHKLINLLVSPDLHERYLSELRDTYYAAHVIQKTIESVKIDAIVLYNSMYSVNKIVAEVARSSDIDTYFLHAGSNLSERLQSLMIGKNDAYSFYANLIENWPKFSENTYTLEQYKKVTDHFKELLNAKSIFTYSIKKSSTHNNIRDFFCIPDSSKILVATMASYDEEIAAEFIGAKKTFNNEIFFSQIDWVKALISYAEVHPNIFLVIRPHPREFSNRREKKTSEHAKQILDLIASGLPLNVRFNLPGDGISIYDFIDEADVFLNSWSNVGKEIAIFGVPVVIYSKNNLYYHPDLNYIGSNKVDYFKKIEEAIENGWSFHYVVKAFKWYVYEQQTALISLHSVCNLKEANSKKMITLVIEKFFKFLSPKFLYSFNIYFFKKGRINFQFSDKLFHFKAKTMLDIMDIKKEVSADEEIKFIEAEFFHLLRIALPVNYILESSRIYKNYQLFLNNNDELSPRNIL